MTVHSQSSRSRSSLHIVSLALGVAVLALLGACGTGGTEGESSSSDSAALQSIEVDVQLSLLTLASGMDVSALGHFDDGTSADITGQVAWSSTDGAVADFAESGQVVALQVGTADIIAVDPETGISGSATVSVTAAQLLSIDISPGVISLALGLADQLTATGHYSDGTEADLTDSVEWASEDGLVAGVEPDGSLSALGQGTTTVTATETVSGIIGEAEVDIGAAVVVELVVLPEPITLSVGLDTDLQVIGIFSDGTETDLTATVDFSVGDGLVAEVDANGNVLGADIGATTVLVVDPETGVEAEVNIGVTNAVLQSLRVLSLPTSLPLGLGQALTVLGTYSDGTEVNLTGAVQFASDNEGVAKVGAGAVLGSLGLGSAEISITEPSSGVTTSFEISVTAAVLESLAILPGTLSLPLGISVSVQAIGTFSDSSTQDLTSQVDWESQNGSLVTVSAAGLVAGVGLGSANVTASHAGIGGGGPVSAQVSVGVLDAVLQAITVSPLIPTVSLGLTRQFAATGHFSDGSTANVTSLVNWSSTNALVSSLLGDGLFSALGIGSATIRATDPATGKVGEAELTVTSATLQSLAILPGTLDLPLGITTTVQVIGTYSDGSTADLTSQITWDSDNALVASVTAGGLILGVALGSTDIQATHSGSGLTAEVTVDVVDALLESITVTATSLNVVVGLTRQFTATGHFSDGSTANLTSSVTWQSLNSLVALLLGNGLFSALGVGDTVIRATDPDSGIQGEAELEACLLIVLCD